MTASHSPKPTPIVVWALVLASVLLAPLFIATGTASAQQCTKANERWDFATGACVTLADEDSDITDGEFWETGIGKGLKTIMRAVSVLLILFGAWRFAQSFRGGGGMSRGIQALLGPLIGAFLLFDLSFTVNLMRGIGQLIMIVLRAIISTFA